MSREKFKWTLNEGIKKRLGDGRYGRQRTIAVDDQMLVILHEPPKVDVNERIVSVFLREKDGSWLHNGQRKGEGMLQRLLEDYRQQFEQYEKKYNKAKTSDDLFLVLEGLNPVLRAIKNLELALQDARQACPDDKLALTMRDEASDCLRNFELLAEEARLALDYRMAKNAETQIEQSQKMAKAQHKLNLMAAITFPMMALSSLFGMNLMSGLEDSPKILFYMVVTFGFVVGIGALRWVLKDRK